MFEMSDDFQIKREEILRYLKNLNIPTNLDIKTFEEFCAMLHPDSKLGRSVFLAEVENPKTDHIAEENIGKWMDIFMFGANSLEEYDQAIEYISQTIFSNHITSPSMELKPDGTYKLTDQKIKRLKAEVEKKMPFKYYSYVDFELTYAADRALEIEQTKLSTYTPGVCIVIIQMQLEKFLKNAVEVVKKNKLGVLKPNIVFSSNSEIDNNLEFLQKTIGLDYTKNFALKGAIFKLRNARNAFAHGSWDNLQVSLNQIQISEILEQLEILQTAILIRMFRCINACL
jgi:hypothetical protein